MTQVSKRRKSRELALQMLFQADMAKQTPDDVRDTFWRAADPVEDSVRHFAGDLFNAAIERKEAIDELITAHSRNWRLERMAAVDRNLLRLAIGEMLAFRDTPFPIVIDEALQIARRYADPSSIQFLNGVLDAIAHELVDQRSGKAKPRAAKPKPDAEKADAAKED